MKKFNWIYFSILFLVIVLIGFEIWNIHSGGLVPTTVMGVRKHHPRPTPTPRPGSPSPTPTQTPTPNPIPHGNKGFSVSSSNPGPTFGRGSINPYDPAIGATQSVTINVSDSINPVKSVSVIIQTDHATNTYPMSLASGTTSSGIWGASWTVSGAYNYTYKATITAVSASGTNSVTITLR